MSYIRYWMWIGKIDKVSMKYTLIQFTYCFKRIKFPITWFYFSLFCFVLMKNDPRLVLYNKYRMQSKIKVWCIHIDYKYWTFENLPAQKKRGNGLNICDCLIFHFKWPIRLNFNYRAKRKANTFRKSAEPNRNMIKVKGGRREDSIVNSMPYLISMNWGIFAL